MRKFFQLVPSAETLFHNDVNMQRKTVSRVVHHIARACDTSTREAALADSVALGQRHSSYGAVNVEHFNSYRSALLQTLAETLATVWSPQMARAWENSIDSVLKEMQKGLITEQQVVSSSMGDQVVRTRIFHIVAQNVKDANLSSYKIQKFPDGLSGAVGLVSLNLEENSIPELTDALGALTALKSLNCSKNRITIITPKISNLTALEDLNLSCNWLKEVPAEIGGCTALKRLDLSKNKLKSLGGAVGELRLLSQLDLSSNKLRDLPWQLGFLPELKQFNVRENALKIRGVPLDSPDVILSVLREKDTGGFVKVNKVRVLVMGAPSSGKTTLLNVLRGEKFAHVEPTTFLELKKHTVEGNIELLTIEFGGKNAVLQDHPLLEHCEQNTISLITFDMANFKTESLSYFVRIAGALKAPIILVGTRSDRSVEDPKIVLRTVQTIVSRALSSRHASLIVDYVVTSSKQNVKIKTLRKLITHVSSKLVEKNQVPVTYVRLMETLGQMASSRRPPLCRYEEFCSAAVRCGIEDPRSSVLTVNHCGAAIVRPQIVILSPLFLSVLMKTVDRMATSGNGVLSKAHFFADVLEDFPDAAHDPLVALLESFGVILLADVLKQQVIVPSCLSEEPAVEFSKVWRANESNLRVCTRVYHCVEGAPGLFTGLLSRLLKGFVANITMLWRNGIAWSYSGVGVVYCCVLFVPETSKVIVQIKGQQIQNTLMLHDVTMSSLAANCLRVYVFCPCATCLSVVCETESTLSDLAIYRLGHDVVEYVSNSTFGRLMAPPTVAMTPRRREGSHGNITYFSYIGLERHFMMPQHKSGISSFQDILCDNCHEKAKFEDLCPDLALSDTPQLSLGKNVVAGKKLGAGGFGSVRKGVLRGGATVAVKVFQSAAGTEMSPDEQLILFTSFRREVEAMRLLHSANIIRFLAVDFDGPAIIMEYVPRGDLYTLLRRKRFMNWPLALRIGMDVAKGLYCMHTNFPALIHRDIKSPNVLLMTDAAESPVVAKICDMGHTIAAAGANTQRSIFNADWLSPEVLRGEAPTTASDIFSLGIILWELLSRSHPYSDMSEEKFNWKKEDAIIAGRRPAISLLTPDLYANLLRSCWNSSQHSRPDAGEVLTMLSDIQREIPLFENYDELSREAEVDMLSSSSSSSGDVEDVPGWRHNQIDGAVLQQTLYEQQAEAGGEDVDDLDDDFLSQAILAPPQTESTEETEEVDADGSVSGSASTGRRFSLTDSHPVARRMSSHRSSVSGTTPRRMSIGTEPVVRRMSSGAEPSLQRLLSSNSLIEEERRGHLVRASSGSVRRRRPSSQVLVQRLESNPELPSPRLE